MFLINTDETLYQVTTYKLDRADGTLTIQLQEALTNSPNKFTAVPFLDSLEAPEEFCGYGEASEEALNDCLKKIKDKTITTDLFPHTVS